MQPVGSTSDPAPVVPEGSAFPPSDEKTVISRRPIGPQSPVPPPVRPAEVGRSLIGETLGHFQLEEFVGGGGMGAVFRAVDTTLGRTVAVKVVSNQSADEDMLRRFRNEAQSAARLDHPNIARVYYVGEEKSWSYIVFEFIEGVNIRDLVEQQGPLPIDEVISYTLQIAEALEHASERDVVHRDIKPSNILVMPDGRSKLVDMGLARLHQVDSPSQDLTETGVTLGTFDYISPEQARDPRSADVRSDLYSLGCTLYYMLTGTPPFPEGTVLQKLLSHSSDPPPDPRELRADLDDDLCAITLRLMAKLPGQRYQSPEELIDRLLSLSDRLGLPHERRFAHSPSAPASTWQSFVRQHLPWAVPAILLVTTVFGLEAVLPQPRAVTHDALRPFPQTGDGIGATAAPAPLNPPSRNSSETLTPNNDSSSHSSAPNSQQTTPSESGSRNIGDKRATTTSNPADSPISTPVTSVNGVKSSEPPRDQQPPASSAQPDRVESVDGNRAADAVPASRPATGDENNTTNTVTPSPRANPSIEPSVPINPSLLIVSSEALPSDNPQVVGSLDAAFQKLATLPQVETIELRFRQRIESPLTLVPRSKDGELTIRGGDDYSPLIVFRPSNGESRDRNFFKVIGGKVNFVGVHFRVELSNHAVDDWSLFHLKDTGRVKFTNCSLTIRNDRGATATFFSIDAPTPAKMMMPTDTPEVPTGPLIELKSCVVRGDANVVRAVSGLPFRLNWNQGFLATSQPAVIARGMHDTNGTRLIGLSFSNVTGSLGAGLCLIDLDATAPVVPDLLIQTSNCVWLQLDPDAPLVEHRGIDNLEPLVKNLFRYAGEQNLYPSTRVLWRIQAKSGEIVNHRWRDPAPGMWYTEGSIDKGVRWRRALPAEGRATFTYSFKDFVLESELASMAGFNELSLPEPREPDPDSPAPVKPTPTRPDTPL